MGEFTVEDMPVTVHFAVRATKKVTKRGKALVVLKTVPEPMKDVEEENDENSE